MNLEGSITPFWNIQQVKQLPFKLDKYKKTDLNELYVQNGHFEESLTLYNCFEQDIDIDLSQIYRHFSSLLENINLAVNLFKPGQYLPVHSDLYTKYRQLHSLDNDQSICRCIIFLEDWQQGQILQIGKTAYTDWKSGDWYGWTDSDEHSFFNLGIHNRYAVQLTGTFL